jgi:hypothetical protein
MARARRYRSPNEDNKRYCRNLIYLILLQIITLILSTYTRIL